MKNVCIFKIALKVPYYCSLMFFIYRLYTLLYIISRSGNNFLLDFSPKDKIFVSILMNENYVIHQISYLPLEKSKAKFRIQL